MAVLRSTAESPTPLVNGVSGLGLVCLVVALVGIKLKWFKQRLTFNSINEDADGASTTRGFYSTNGSSAVDGGGGGVHRNSSVSSEPQIVRATFRSFDESFEITPPTVLPPIRITNNRPPLKPRVRAPPPPPPTLNDQPAFNGVNADTLLIVKNSTHFPTSEPLEDTISSIETNKPTTFNDDDKSEPTTDQPDETSSSSRVGSVSVDVLPSNKQTILFASTENIYETSSNQLYTIDDNQDHLVLPASPKPPNSPPPRPSQLENYRPTTAPIIPVPFNVPPTKPPTHPPPPPPYSEFDQPSEIVKAVKPKRQVRIVTPEVSERSDSGESDEDGYSYSFEESTRTRSTPDLSLPPPNAIRPYLQLSPDPPEPKIYQSTPNLSESPFKPNPIASFFSFLHWRTPVPEKSSGDVPKKKTRTIRVLKEAKVDAKLLNPLVQSTPPEQLEAAPKPFHRKKKQHKLEAQLKQANGKSPIVQQPIPNSPAKSVRFAAEPPVPKQRTILNVPLEPNGFVMFKDESSVQAPARANAMANSDDSSDEDTWNMVAQHRRNHAAVVAKQAEVIKKVDAVQPAGLVVNAAAAGRTLELFNRPKTLREMQREKREQQEQRQAASRERADVSDTEA